MDPKSKKRLDGYKYILIGGWVTSKNDGQMRYLYASTVGVLYGIESNEVYRSFDDEEQACRLYGVDIRGLTILRPDPTGKYQLPSEEE
jgi:hypothetical protein